MRNTLSKIALSAALLISAGALGGCVSSPGSPPPAANTPVIDNCPGDSVLINGQCVGVDEDGNPK